MFYPQDFTFVCPTEVIAFGERIQEFQNMNCALLACSTDSVAAHRAWMRTPKVHGGIGHIQMPLMADTSHAICKSYNVLKEDEGVAFRAQYIIDDKGKIRHFMMNDFPVGRNVDECLRLVQGFQFTDSAGDVCPANWKPGKKTFKPTFNEVAKFMRTASEG